MRVSRGWIGLCVVAGCSGGAHGPPTNDGGLKALGPVQTGQYNLGPVAWSGSFWNACAPYPASIQSLEGDFLAGLSNQVASSGADCDACIDLTTAKGKELVLRVVTYGVSNAAGDVDLSQAAYDALSEGEYPRAMSWRLVECPTPDPLWVQFQTAANLSWTSLWIRNPRVAVAGVLVQSAHHASAFALTRGTDGTFTDSSGFGSGAFTLQVTGVDGIASTQSFSGFTGGALLEGNGNLQ